MINENLLSYFPAREYNVIDDLAETIINPANCRSSTMNLVKKDNFNFAQLEPVYVYTDITKPNFVGDTYLRILTSLHFPSNTGYHKLYYLLYKPVEKSFIESISIGLVMKTRENMLFEVCDIRCIVVLHFKKSHTA